MENSIFVTVVFSIATIYIFFLIVLLVDNVKTTIMRYFKVLYIFLLFCILITSILMIIQQLFSVYIQILWIICAILLLYGIRMVYFIINIGRIKYLLSLKVIIEIVTEYYVLVCLGTFWTINSIFLFFVPKEEQFIIVCILTSILPSWFCWRKKSVKIANIMVPAVFNIYLFGLAMISLVRSFYLFYQSYEVIIFISVSYYLISQSILEERFLDFFGFDKVLNTILKKSFFRFIILVITNLTTLINKEFDIFRSINMGILLSLAFDSLKKDIERIEKRKFDEAYIKDFIFEHQQAYDEYSKHEYLSYMSKKYGKIKLIDICYIDESIADYYVDTYVRYLPPVQFIPYMTIGCLYETVSGDNFFLFLDELFVYIKKMLIKVKNEFVNLISNGHNKK